MKRTQITKRKPYTKKDFAWTQWRVKDIEEIEDVVLGVVKKNYEAIKKIPKEKRTFENTILAFEKSDYEVSHLMGKADFLMYVSPDARTRNTAQKVIDRLQHKLLDLYYDQDLYSAIKEYVPNKGTLSSLDKKLYEDIVDDFRRAGFDLSDNKRKKLISNVKELQKLSNAFQKNINEYEDYILVTKEELRGLPKTYIESLKKDKTGKYKISLSVPDYVPYMRHAENSKKRKELFDKYDKKGGKKNLVILKKMLFLRDENAKLLGYKNHVDYVTEKLTAKNQKNVLRFCNNLASKTKKAYKKESKELLDFKREALGDKNAKLFYYEEGYWGNKLKEHKYGVKDEEVQQYFTLNHTTESIFSVYGELLGVTFKRINNYPVYEKNVPLYSVSDKKTGSIVGYFFLDLFPRSGKYSHFAQFDIIVGSQALHNKDTYVAPVAALVCNFPLPTKKAPSLLNYRDVNTYFHEFGHLMHELLTEVPYRSYAGTSVARDFVEMPSQMLEYWVEDKDVLKRISKHYKTGKKLPDNLIQKIISLKNFFTASFVVRQLTYTYLDQKLHSTHVKHSPEKLWRKLVKELEDVTLPKTNLFPAGLGHMVGYDGKYYSYLWAQVFAADMFTRFKKEGLLNKKTGMDYRKKVLARGSSVDEMQLIKDFLGRPPNEKAFLKEIGVK